MKHPRSAWTTCLENSSLNWKVWLPVSILCWYLSPVPKVATCIPTMLMSTFLSLPVSPASALKNSVTSFETVLALYWPL